MLKWLFGPSCIVYTACKMTGRDRAEMVRRAEFVKSVLEAHQLKVISPVIEEQVKDEPGKLVNNDKERLRGFWKRDKHIIRRVAHVVLLDHGEMKSFGMEREYSLNRGTLWKPTVLLIEHGTPLSVAEFEDDYVTTSVHSAADVISNNWLTRARRWKWRILMLNRSLPAWLWNQCLAWR